MVVSRIVLNIRMFRNVYFFFSSRRRHTRYWRDWSSDVCSSDLIGLQIEVYTVHHGAQLILRSGEDGAVDVVVQHGCVDSYHRSAVGDALRAGIFIGILCREVILTTVVEHLYGKALRVDIEGKWLLREFFY